MRKQSFNLTAAAYAVEDQHVLTFNAVDDDVLAHGKTAQAGRKSSSRRRPTWGQVARRKKPVADGINHAIRNPDAVAFLGDVIPDVVEFGFGLRWKPMRHYGPQADPVRAASPLRQGPALIAA